MVYDASVYDASGNYKVDTWAYLDATGRQVVRVEVDENEDGIIDRTQLFEDGELVGTEGTASNP